MNDILQMGVTIFCSVMASSGLWAYLQSRHDKDDATADMLKGLGHDRIIALGNMYIERGYITADEYDNLYNYLYKPYVKLKGNGTAEKIMNDVKRLPIRNDN